MPIRPESRVATRTVKAWKVRVCTFDNPATMARECWQDGKLLVHYSAEILPPFARYPIPARSFFFGANIGPWQTGRLVGDVEAMDAVTARVATGDSGQMETFSPQNPPHEGALPEELR